MAPLPPRPSWVTVTDAPEPPDGYGSPLAPWRPAGRKSLTQSQVFLNQVPVSRPSSAPSTAAPSARPSSGSSASRPPSAAAPRPQSAPVRPRSAPRRLQPSRPSSAWRPSSAPAGPRGPATGISVSWRGRRYRVRQPGDRSQLSMTSLESVNAMASFSIYTDHGLSDDEDHPRAEGAEGGAEAAQDAAPDAASTEMAAEAESEDSSRNEGSAAEAETDGSDLMKMWSGKATLGVLQVTVPERPLYAELTLGGEMQSTSCVTGRWPSCAEELTFRLKDLRVEQTLTLCFWTSVGECKSSSRPRCVAYGKSRLNFEETERQVTVTLDVHQNGQLLRGLAVLHLEVSGCTSETDIFDHSDENCSRNLLLSRRFKGRRFRGIQERPVGPMDRVMDVNARCWSYLEQRSSFLKLRRQECQQRIRKAQALRAGPVANQGTPKLSRISSEQAFRLQRFLRSFVKCGQHGSRELAKVTAEAFKASELRCFLSSLQVPHLSEDDASALSSLLCEDGEVQMKTFLNFVEHGVTVVPPARVIYPDEQRARDILKELFPGFLAKEQQREMDLWD